MNVHHLELFYYVAKHGGISAAVRHIPYGIQQPAVSGQMGALEDSLGVRLFERSPFRLTPAGEQLFAHVRPFFEGLDAVVARLGEGLRQELRVGATELVLRLHMPKVVQLLRDRHPKLRLSLRPGNQTQLEAWLRDGVLDLAVAPIDPRPQNRLRQLRLVGVPPVLLVHRTSPLRRAEDLWKQKKIRESLIGVPATTSLMRDFQRGLKKLGVTWAQTTEVTSMELVTCYVANGEGHGVNLAIPEAIRHPEVRVLPLDGFEPMDIGLLWKGEPSELLQIAIRELQRYAQETWPDWAIRDELPAPKARRRRVRKV